MIVTLAGQNRYILMQDLQEIIQNFTKEHGDLALEKIEATDATYEQIAGAIESLPFLASKKMVIVYDLSENKDAATKYEQLLEKAGGTTDLVLVESKPDKRSVLYKGLKKRTDLREYTEPDESKLADWLADQAEALDAKLSKTDARYLVQRVGMNQLKLSKELEKLANYEKKITRQNIDLLTEESPSSTIFNLVDAVFSGNTKRALAIYEDQRRQRVEPQAIHGMLVWQMHSVAICVSAPDQSNLAKESGISPYTLQKSQRIANAMGRAQVIKCMQLLRDIDYKGKHQTFDYDEALKFVIISLGYPR